MHRQTERPDDQPATNPGLKALLGSRLRRWRKERRIPLKQLAAELKVSLSVVSAWEKGVRFPSVTHLEQLAVYTDMPACRLLYPGPDDCPHARLGR